MSRSAAEWTETALRGCVVLRALCGERGRNYRISANLCSTFYSKILAATRNLTAGYAVFAKLAWRDRHIWSKLARGLNTLPEISLPQPSACSSTTCCGVLGKSKRLSAGEARIAGSVGCLRLAVEIGADGGSLSSLWSEKIDCELSVANNEGRQVSRFSGTTRGHQSRKASNAGNAFPSKSNSVALSHSSPSPYFHPAPSTGIHSGSQ